MCITRPYMYTYAKKLHKYESRSEREVNLDFDIRTSSRLCSIEVRSRAI